MESSHTKDLPSRPHNTSCSNIEAQEAQVAVNNYDSKIVNRNSSHTAVVDNVMDATVAIFVPHTSPSSDDQVPMAYEPQASEDDINYMTNIDHRDTPYPASVDNTQVVPPTLDKHSTHSIAPPTSHQHSTHCIALPTLSQHLTHSVVPPNLRRHPTHSVAPPTLHQCPTHSVAPSALSQRSTHSVASPTISQHPTHSIAPPTLPQQQTHSVVAPTAHQYPIYGMT